MPAGRERTASQRYEEVCGCRSSRPISNMGRETSRVRAALPHQADVLQWASKRCQIALFLQMRLGKTLVAIRWAKKRLAGKPDPVLIVAPKPTWEAWEDECEAEQVVLMPLDGPVKERHLVAQEELDSLGPTWFITNYEGLFERKPRGVKSKKPWPSGLAVFPWSVVILDESTKIRMPKSQTSQVACAELARAKSKAILTGLPNPEGSLDYFQQFKFLYGRFLGCTNWFQFRSRYYEQFGYDWNPKPGTLPLIRTRVDRQAYVLTRKQAGLGERKIYERRYVDLPEHVRAAMAEAERDFAIGDCETKWIPVVQNWLSQLTGGRGPHAEFHHDAKLDELVDLLTGELKKEPTVVWFWFNDQLRAADERLRAAGVSTVRLHGGVGRELRKERLRLCRQGKRRVALVQLRLGRFGLNYSFASTAIYFSNGYEHEIRAQSEDRIVHLQKKDPLLYVDLVARDSIDEDILDSLGSKAASAAVFRSKIIAKLKARIATRAPNGGRVGGS